MQQEPRSFTLVSNKIVNVLITLIGLSEPFDPLTRKKKKSFKAFNAIWDTGATNTVISQRVIKECKLEPISMVKVYTAGGTKLSAVFLVNIMLPQRVGISYLKVTEGDLPTNTDVLIGMDIITQGDFVITNKNWRTTFSFRIPSIEYIEFRGKKTLHAEPSKVRNTSKVGRNDPCPCGSGKKYKNCCGKKL